MSLSRESFNSLKKLPFYKGKVVTGSMVPVINIDEDIVIEIGAKNLKRFDIIVIFLDGKLICHYLWQMNKMIQPILLQTRNIRGGRDIPVSLDDYLGKVVSHKISFWRKLKILFLAGL